MSKETSMGYRRYCGLIQGSPLTADEQRYDDACRQIDQLQEEIGSMPVGVFLAHELLWFNWFACKTFVAPSQERLDRQLAELRALKSALESRALLPEASAGERSEACGPDPEAGP